MSFVGNRVGTNAAGTGAAPNGVGVQVNDAFEQSTVRMIDNVISGNHVGIQGNNLLLEHGNRIGVGGDGATAIPNDIGVQGIGGSAAEETTHVRLGEVAGCTGPCNVISGNRVAGVQIDSDAPTRFESYGSYIGVAADGTTAVPNGDGIDINAPAGGSPAMLTIGGTSSAFFAHTCDGPCNVIAANHGVGIRLTTRPSVTGTGTSTIAGNMIGEAKDATVLTNDGSAIEVIGSDADRIVIGGDDTHGNRIATTGANPVAFVDGSVANPPRVSLLTNRLQVHTAADAIDKVGSPAPLTLPGFVRHDDGITVTGSTGVTGDPFADPERLELYASADAACGGDLLPVADTTAAVLGGGFTFSLPVAPLVGRPFLTALRTDQRGATSVFSECIQGPLATRTTADSLVGSTEVPVESNDGFAPGDTVRANGETRRVAAIGSLIFSAPIATTWPAGTMIVQVDPPGGDVTPPTITASTPTVSLGAVVVPTVTCIDAGVGVESCVFPAALDTAAAGPHAFTVTAWDRNGNTATTIVDYDVIDDGVPPTTGATVSSGGTLARTGSDVAALVRVAMVALAFGVLLLLAARERRRRSAS